MRLRLFANVITLGALSTAPALAQAPPQPGPEHALLKAEAGTWDAALEMAMPDGTKMTAKGVQTDAVGCNGLCLITDFKADMMGMPFEGHGLTTWDPAKKKYVGSWADSMTPGMATTEGTYDPAAKKMTTWMEALDPSGTVGKMRSENAYPDADHKSMTMFMKGPDGKDAEGMKIVYTRRK
jgi:Protein of unknown function (DUF1579)